MRTTYPTYYEESVDADYPFESGASRSNGDIVIENDVFVDGRLFPPAGRYDLFISEISVSDEVVITLSDGTGIVSTGTFTRSSPPEYVSFVSDGVHLGILQGHPVSGLSKLAGWADGAYAFIASQTKLAASIVVPQPQAGVRSLVLDSGAVFFDEVTLIGERGVQFTMKRDEGSSSSVGVWNGYSGHLANVIRMDVVGDPLFVRRGCDGQESEFQRDDVITGINFDGTLFTPNSTGGFLITTAHTSSNRPALRILPELNGISVGFVEK